ncbi:hypothetical protein [Nocardia sp. NPDC058705]|uniref:hypothetical protein n=1 Tax=Nocardia sp. NPDC058705 TaxID=3346609 RepID=UPI003678186E
MVLDACVLVPIVKSDLLLTLGKRHAFCPLWSQRILGEVSRAVVKVNPQMSWGLPDVGDRHVVAAAVRGNAAAIATDNIKHFPDDALRQWGMHAISSDDFLLDVLDLSPSMVLSSLIEMVGRRKNPPVTVDDILHALSLANVPRFVHEIRAILDEGI